MVEDRLLNFKKFLNDEIIKGGSKISEWKSAPTIKNLIVDIEQLESLGKNYLSRGLNCSADDADGDLIKYGDRLKRYINFQEELFLKLTNLNISVLHTPDVCNIYGKRIDKNTVIYPTSYRLGYYANQLKNNLSNPDEHQAIIEIGGGFGTLNYILNKLLKTTYIMIDIPQTLINVGYILYKYDIPFLFYNEIDDINKFINEKKEVIILAPPPAVKEIDNCNAILAMDCISEFPTSAIDYYVENINRIKPDIFYTDYTNLANGKHVESKLKGLEGFNLSVDQLTPITAYMCHYMSDDYGKNDIMKEKLYKRA